MIGDINKYQIDYIMVKNRFRNQVKERCSEIETLIKAGSRDEAYKMVKIFFSQYLKLEK